MKKFLFFFLIMVIVFLYGCSSFLTKTEIVTLTADLIDTTDPDMLQRTEKSEESTSVVLPQTNTKPDNMNGTLKKIGKDAFTVVDTLDSNYYGYKVKYNAQNDEFILLSIANDEETALTYPDNLSSWVVGSGSYIIMQGRYLYEWRSYTSQFDTSTGYDLKLTRTDGKTGQVEVIDEMWQNYPFVYLCKVDDTRFLSYIVTKAPSNRVEYATQTVAVLYNIDGTKKEIISEKYENDASWKNSKGILIERFAIKDGEIFGIGRRMIDGKYHFFKYHYDINGAIKDSKDLPGFEKIIGNEQANDLFLVGNYIVFRTYESQSTYVCKITPNKEVELIAKGLDGRIQYAITDKNIYFIENNVDINSDKVINKKCPLYVIDTESETVSAINLHITLKLPYFVSLKSFSNGNLVVSYCENGKYDPEQVKQFAIL
ncbi:MAG: hypothetical protein MJ168_08400 [Clostridia bacterium]|nr:hypothetical protein [Clostridia bacterium]